jgi:hypothetical protein
LLFVWVVLAVEIMAIRVVEFSSRGYEIREFFAYESTYSKEIIKFWSFELMTSCPNRASF